MEAVEAPTCDGGRWRQMETPLRWRPLSDGGPSQIKAYTSLVPLRIIDEGDRMYGATILVDKMYGVVPISQNVRGSTYKPEHVRGYGPITHKTYERPDLQN